MIKIFVLPICLVILLIFACAISHTQQISIQTVGELTIKMLTHDKFHYLEINDKKQTFRFIYPVGEEDFLFTGGYGPIHKAQKFDRINKRYFFVVTSISEDSVCYLKTCQAKQGRLIEFQKTDIDLFQKIDSFCKSNYSFYRIDVKVFSKWYTPDD